MHRPSVRAFTLLEMSVVIAVIGLLIGGAMTAQSFLKNAKLASIMTEEKFYANAWNQFQEKYKSIPGDYSLGSSNWPAVGALPVAGNGDGNSQLMPATSSLVSSGTPTTPEVLYAFQHLARAGFIDGNYQGASILSGGYYVVSPGLNVPKGTWENTVYLFDHPVALDGVVSGDSMYYDGMYGHLVRIAGKSGASTGIPNEAILMPEEAYSIDSKFDDGMPATGAILAAKGSYMLANMGGAAYNANSCTSSDISTAIYINRKTSTNGSNTRRACILFVELGY